MIFQSVILINVDAKAKLVLHPLYKGGLLFAPSPVLSRFFALLVGEPARSEPLYRTHLRFVCGEGGFVCLRQATPTISIGKIDIS